MNKFCYGAGLMIVALVLGVTGCAMMTMPRANQALGQLRTGNEKRAWDLIAAERKNPKVSSQLELCELNGITVQILQRIINKDYLPENKEQIAKESYDYVSANCSDFKMIIGVTEHNYGRTLLTLGKPGMAIPHIKKSLKYVQKGTFEHMMQEDALADIYSSLGKFELRDYHKLKAIEIAETYFIKPRSYRWNMDEFNEWAAYSKILNSRINDLSWMENAEQNLDEMYRRWRLLEMISARWSANETKYMVYTRASQLFAEAGDISFAWKLHNTAKELVKAHSKKFKKKGLGDLKLSKAQILKCEGKYQKAAKLMQEWIEDFRPVYGKPPGANAYRLAGVVQEYAGNYDTAIKYLEKSIAEIEVMRASFKVEMRDSLIGGLVVMPYWSLIRSYSARYLEKALEEDFMGAIRSARMLRTRQFGELLGITYQAGEDLDLASLPLNPHELLLNIILTDRAMIIFAISSEKHHLFMVPYKGHGFNAAAKRVKNALSQPGNSEAYITDLLHISEMVLTPVKGMLTDSQKLIVIPDGVLNGIPFALFSKSSTNYSPLIMDHEIVLTPSISYLIQQRADQYQNKTNKIFALADPIYGRRAVPEVHRDETKVFYTRAVKDFDLFAPLPETRTEVRNIAKLFPISDVTFVFGNQASESTVKSTNLDQYRYLHFATHGILGTQIPGIDEPSLVLASEPESSGEDGFFTMKEVEQLDLGCELTVLSACDTGSGKYFTGEGVMGLSRGFLLAGSRSVLVSLWPVASQATVELMGLFYDNLQSGKSKAESLRLAQLSMMRGYQTQSRAERGIRIANDSGDVTNNLHPFFWAPFVLIGE
jgi:CHAT domain-containing protein/tetratricopeptide (TPR) repeat protein